jgi:hypothetical protein
MLFMLLFSPTAAAGAADEVTKAQTNNSTVANDGEISKKKDLKKKFIGVDLNC